MANQKIRIKLQGLRALDHRRKRGPHRRDREAHRRSRFRPDPASRPRRKSLRILRSPHKHKDSREQFEMRTHKRLIDILNPTRAHG